MTVEQHAPDDPRATRAPVRAISLTLVPVAIFVLLAAVFGYALFTSDPGRLPSMLVGKPAPEFNLPGVEGLMENGERVPGLSNQDLVRAGVSVINVWASWCGPCHQEHPYLVALGERSQATMFSINYKDKPEAARQFLGRYGNPYARVGADTTGRTAIDFGVYGVPETYLTDRRGNIVYRHVGPITPDDLERTLLPLIEQLKADTTG